MSEFIFRLADKDDDDYTPRENTTNIGERHRSVLKFICHTGLYF